MTEHTYASDIPVIYRDSGCEYAVSCLHCPFKECRYDNPLPRVVVTQPKVDKTRELLARGLTAGEVAAIMGVTVRTVHRRKKDRQVSTPVKRRTYEDPVADTAINEDGGVSEPMPKLSYTNCPRCGARLLNRSRERVCVSCGDISGLLLRLEMEKVAV